MNTFDEKRAELIRKLDDKFAELRKIVSDPEWRNEIYPPFKKACEEFNQIMADLRSLNVAENL